MSECFKKKKKKWGERKRKKKERIFLKTKEKKYNGTRFAALLPRNLRNTKMLVNCISNEFLFCGEYIKLQFVVQLWQAFKPPINSHASAASQEGT